MQQLDQTSHEAPLNREAERLESFITPDHFVRCHFAQPRPPAELWVGGAQPAPWSVDALRARPQRTLAVTLECAGNGRSTMAPLPPGEPWEKGAVSTAIWTGVPLSSLLTLRDDTVEILLRGADGFERSLPRGEIESALVALEMNGAPIPHQHGGPMRLIVPGWYGMASTKWLAAIDALTEPFHGKFQTESYVYDDKPVTMMRVRSRIVSTENGLAWGWAWSGDGAIAAVEISLDSGSFQPAQVAKQLSPYAWVRWHAALPPLGHGRHTLRSRARDSAGNLQPEAPIWNRLGYGNNAVETFIFSC